MPSTLLTGANGFVAAAVLKELISQGHNVTGSVRSIAKGEQILATHPEYKGKLDFVVLSDYGATGVWDEVFQTHNFDYVIHTAAPVLDDPKAVDAVKDFVEPSIKWATEILKSVSAYGKNVKAIVVTGSINAVTDGSDVATRTYESDSWLPLTIDDAVNAPKEYYAYYAYCVAKKESEKAIWKFVNEEKPTYSVSVLLPALIFGPPEQPITDLKKINYSTDVLYSLFNGTHKVTPPTSFASYIDSRDLAYAHVKALTTPAVFNKRFLIGGKQYSSQIGVNALKTVPELAGRVPKENDEDTPVPKFADVEEWNRKLGLKLRTVEETFVDTAKKILELEKTLGKK